MSSWARWCGTPSSDGSRSPSSWPPTLRSGPKLSRCSSPASRFLAAPPPEGRAGTCGHPDRAVLGGSPCRRRPLWGCEAAGSGQPRRARWRPAPSCWRPAPISASPTAPAPISASAQARGGPSQWGQPGEPNAGGGQPARLTTRAAGEWLTPPAPPRDFFAGDARDVGRALVGKLLGPLRRPYWAARRGRGLYGDRRPGEPRLSGTNPAYGDHVRPSSSAVRLLFLWCPLVRQRGLRARRGKLRPYCLGRPNLWVASRP